MFFKGVIIIITNISAASVKADRLTAGKKTATIGKTKFEATFLTPLLIMSNARGVAVRLVLRISGLVG